MTTKRFDPNQHITKLKGKDYLEVKYRLVWFREEWPAGTIDTAIVELTDQRCVVRAEVRKMDDGGEVRGSASGIGSETPRDFGDYIEKAETKAIGRALAALGYGTQFAPELDEGARIVDSPVERATRPQDAPKPRHAGTDTSDATAPVLDREKVLRALHATGKEHDLDHTALSALLKAKGYDSMATAPVEALVDLGKAIRADPGKLKTWLAKQAELMPDAATVPNPRPAESYTQ